MSVYKTKIYLKENTVHKIENVLEIIYEVDLRGIG